VRCWPEQAGSGGPGLLHVSRAMAVLAACPKGVTGGGCVSSKAPQRCAAQCALHSLMSVSRKPVRYRAVPSKVQCPLVQPHA
jgi:hypothetical protein